jgi:hypothetical protein
VNTPSTPPPRNSSTPARVSTSSRSPMGTGNAKMVTGRSMDESSPRVVRKHSPGRPGSSPGRPRSLLNLMNQELCY